LILDRARLGFDNHVQRAGVVEDRHTDTHGAEQVRGFARVLSTRLRRHDVLPVSERRRPVHRHSRLIDGIERERDGDRHDGPRHRHRSQ